METKNTATISDAELPEPVAIYSDTMEVHTTEMSDVGACPVEVSIKVTDYGDDDRDRVEVEGVCDELEERVFSCGPTEGLALERIREQVSEHAVKRCEEIMKLRNDADAIASARWA